MTLIAYHGNQSEKDAILAQLQQHYDADELRKGYYWENGKGCAVGCTIHGDEHAQYEPVFGIPQALAYLEDTIFERLPNVQAKEWPLRFMRAVQPGADLSRVQFQFMYWLLTDESVNPGIKRKTVVEAVSNVAKMLLAVVNDEDVSAEHAEQAADEADLAYWRADDTSDDVAAASAKSAESAALYLFKMNDKDGPSWASSASYVAGKAAWSVYEASEDVYEASEDVYEASEDVYEASEDKSREDATWSAMADKLIEFIEAAPMAK